MSLTTLLWLAFVSVRLCAGYNLEVSKFGSASGQAGSQFGYTVVFVDKPGSGTPAKKLLLSGAPNLTVDGIRAHGDVFRCGPTTMKESDCTPMNLKDPGNVCRKLMTKTNNARPCEEDSRMGATMALNRKYLQASSTNISMVMVCAPGWKNVLYAGRELMYGMCLHITDNLEVLDCQTGHSARNFCWPFWARNEDGERQTDAEGRSVFAYAIGGFSAAFTNDGKSAVVGAPGVKRNRGSFRAYQKDWLKSLDWTDNSTSYFGYALASGTFGNGANLVVGNPNFHTSLYGHRGRVRMLTYSRACAITGIHRTPDITEKLNNKISTAQDKVGMFDGTDWTMPIEFNTGASATACVFPDEAESLDLKDIKMQVGSKFGAAVAAIDIDGDGSDEVFVGAPLYSDRNVEEGRVFVYSAKSDVCVVGILSGAAKDPSLEEQTSYGRFGTAIAPAGDLDADGYNDVAIGAPYENGGSGVVYIYMGIGNCRCHMSDKYAQRIVGEKLDLGIRSFGFSLFGGDDVDNNGFPDVAIGAYASDKAFILRSRPVVKVTATMVIRPTPIPLVATNLDCSQDKRKLCFNMTLSIAYEVGPGNALKPMKFRYHLNADTRYKKKENGRSRVVFRDNKKSEFNGTEQLDKDRRTFSKEFTIDVNMDKNGNPEPRDPWTTVQLSGYYELIPSTDGDFETLDYILPRSAKQNFSTVADFDKKCDNIAECTSDLDLTMELYLLGRGQSERVNESTVIYVDDKNQLEMVMEVTNIQNTSYRTNVSADVLAVLRRDVIQDGAISAECKYDLYTMPTEMNCTAQKELDKHEDMRIRTNFDISRARLVPETENLHNMQRFVNISVYADQGNTDTDLTNNKFFISIPVLIKSQIDITVDTKTSDQVRYNADPESGRGINVRHIYYVTNNGPSFLPKTFVNISIPYKRDGETFAKITSNSLCTERGMRIQTTTQPPVTVATTLKDYDIDEPDKQRKRRATGPDRAKLEEKPDTKKEQTTNIRNITCEEYECVVFECKLVEMERSDIKTIRLSISVSEKEIAREKGAREVRFVTNASATPPTVWFSGKVVPWDREVEESKTTTFIVEPASVVTEVDIWIIIGSVIGAVALLAIILLILWKTGFFRRSKQEQMRKLRQESLYKRRSQMRPTSTTSRTNNPPYSHIDSGEEKS